MDAAERVNDELKLAAINLDKLGTSKKANIDATARKVK
jgi:hypothetical protein